MTATPASWGLVTEVPISIPKSLPGYLELTILVPKILYFKGGGRNIA